MSGQAARTATKPHDYCICGNVLTDTHQCPTDNDLWIRCTALLDTRPLTAGGSDLTPCKLPQGHEGPHRPVKR